ncbi:MAG: hypothetical protein OWS03_08345 [Alicyclobacillaceae bacterium]|nr:hypothetical protein [Alicyclobacillaceae bacterium]
MSTNRHKFGSGTLGYLQYNEEQWWTWKTGWELRSQRLKWKIERQVATGMSVFCQTLSVPTFPEVLWFWAAAVRIHWQSKAILEIHILGGTLCVLVGLCCSSLLS